MKQAAGLPRQQASTLDAVFGQHLVRQLYVVWTYGRRATQAGLFFGFGVITAVLRAHHICLSLYPFSLKVVSRNSNSSCRLSFSHTAPTPCNKVVRTACMLEGWRHDRAFR